MKQEPLHNCTGCTDKNSEGTHQMHTIQHPCPENGDPHCGYCFPEKTPRIEEEYFGSAHEAGWYEPDELVVSWSLFKQAITEAYQAGQKESNEDIRLLAEEIERLREDVEIARKEGIEDAVEIIKKQKDKVLTSPEGETAEEYSVRLKEHGQTLNDVIKALQDNK